MLSNLYTHAHTNTHAHTLTHTGTHAQHIHTHARTHTHTHTLTLIHSHTQARTHACTHTYTHMHTHTHTHDMPLPRTSALDRHTPTWASDKCTVQAARVMALTLFTTFGDLKLELFCDQVNYFFYFLYSNTDTKQLSCTSVACMHFLPAASHVPYMCQTSLHSLFHRN